MTLADHGHRLRNTGSGNSVDWREFYEKPLPEGMGPIQLLRRFGLPVGDVDLRILAFGPHREPTSIDVARALQQGAGAGGDPSRPRMRRQRLLLGARATKEAVPPGTMQLTRPSEAAR